MNNIVRRIYSYYSCDLITNSVWNLFVKCHTIQDVLIMLHFKTADYKMSDQELNQLKSRKDVERSTAMVQTRQTWHA